MIIKKLTMDDLYAWKALRLDSLQNCPHRFTASFEEDSKLTDADWVQFFSEAEHFGVFFEEHLVSIASLSKMRALKTTHRGILWGVYTAASFQGRGFAKLLIQHILNYAKKDLLQIHLQCAQDNSSALRLYQSLGFIEYGLEPRTIKVNDQFYDAVLMVICF